MERTWSCFDCRLDDAEPLCFTAGGTFDPHRLARAYLKIRPAHAAGAEDGASMQAFDCVDEMLHNAPGPSVAFLLAALDACRTAAHVAILGAGPLETLLKTHGPAVICIWNARRASTPRCATCCRRRGAAITMLVLERLVIAVAPGPVMDGDARRPPPASAARSSMRPASPRCSPRRWLELARGAEPAKTQGVSSDPPPSAKGTTIYVDADACPVKDEAVRVAERHGLDIHFVSNAFMRLPERGRGAAYDGV